MQYRGRLLDKSERKRNAYALKDTQLYYVCRKVLNSTFSHVVWLCVLCDTTQEKGALGKRKYKLRMASGLVFPV